MVLGVCGVELGRQLQGWDHMVSLVSWRITLWLDNRKEVTRGSDGTIAGGRFRAAGGVLVTWGLFVGRIV